MCLHKALPLCCGDLCEWHLTYVNSVLKVGLPWMKKFFSTNAVYKYFQGRWSQEKYF